MSASKPLSALVGRLFPDAGATRLPAPTFASPPASAAPKPATARKLWDLEHKHHCPIIGTCLDLAELQHFARRHDFDGDRGDAFALHVEAAARADTRNALSVDIQRTLDRKYAATLRRFAPLAGDADVLAAWQAHLARGEVAAALWAALTHKAASADTRQQIYADIHMLSHQVGAGLAADSRRLACLERENGELRAAANAERRARAVVEGTLRDEVHRLQTQAVRLHADCAGHDTLRRRLDELESGVALVELGRKLVSLAAANDKLSAAAERADQFERQLAERDAALSEACRARDEAQRERDALERLLLATASDEADTPRDEDCDGDCGDCARRSALRNVLCVGGRVALVAQYRALAERLGIRLVHHDGGQEEAISRLPDMINGADAVICPTDCVSHSAYYRLKRHCKRTGKPCLLFKGAGVSSFALALDRLSGTPPVRVS